MKAGLGWGLHWCRADGWIAAHRDVACRHEYGDWIRTPASRALCTAAFDSSNACRHSAYTLKLFNSSTPLRGHAHLSVTATEKKYNPVSAFRFRGGSAVPFQLFPSRSRLFKRDRY
ncbi:hypothetical protein NDU88_007661 [Pleurodeles waltl]|uniref:Uncharacterized protein n=1 Tax=Pleurodeles waltl TaxID=8319 RepID=A0AAV7VV20_PLEWA|nr:hypothetical protein NDU88_007661 [Pleurodeles waltl]